MKSLKQRRLNPNDFVGYGIYNYGRLVAFTYLKRDTRKEAVRWAGKPWPEIENHIEIHKIVVKKIT